MSMMMKSSRRPTSSGPVNLIRMVQPISGDQHGEMRQACTRRRLARRGMDGFSGGRSVRIRSPKVRGRGMGSPEPGAAERFAAALRDLYDAAGRPIYAELIRQGQAQKPPIRLRDASLSDWLSGKSTPSNPAAVHFLVTYLQGRADGHPLRTRTEWEGLLDEAQRERCRKRGGRPAARPRPTLEADPLPEALLSLLRMLRQATEDLPYRQRRSVRLPLSGVYVRQTVTTTPAMPDDLRYQCRKGSLLDGRARA
ncbi:hypothetical protein [Actinomadura sp. WAC 06369]|uniref:hypothetical protein n=1 Tax=Actinomadura sp. WAC 06369 TaxID=2203193 RepID=UPI000F77A9C1|nr:hypothetical protein [Actinomadura sp. WAC 06369]